MVILGSEAFHVRKVIGCVAGHISLQPWFLQTLEAPRVSLYKRPRFRKPLLICLLPAMMLCIGIMERKMDIIL